MTQREDVRRGDEVALLVGHGETVPKVIVCDAEVANGGRTSHCVNDARAALDRHDETVTA